MAAQEAADRRPDAGVERDEVERDGSDVTGTIVVPLDGSELAEEALATAVWLASGLRAEVRLIRVTLGATSSTEGEADAVYLDQRSSDLGVDDVSTAVIDHQFPGAGIVEAVAGLADPVVCMTTRGASGWAEFLLGSVSDEVLQGVAAPVVLRGPACRPGPPDGDRLVVSIDGSEESRAIYPIVADWAPRLGLEVHLVTVAQCGTTGRPDDRAVAAQTLLDEATADLLALGVHAHGHVLNSAYVADVVFAFATGLPAALVAVGTHGRGGLSNKALGGVATEIVRLAPCPVLVRRAGG